MAEIDQDLSSSTSVDSVESSEDNVGSNTRGDDKIQSFVHEILPYQNELLATSSDSNAINCEINCEEEGDEDGLTASALEQRYDKKDTVNNWYVSPRTKNGLDFECVHPEKAVQNIICRLLILE